MGKSKDEEGMRKEDWNVTLCPFCGGALYRNGGKFIHVNDKEKNIYRCYRCNSEFERIDKDKLLLKRKGEIIICGYD